MIHARVLAAFLAAALAAGGTAAGAPAPARPAGRFVPGRVLVSFAGATRAQRAAALSAVSGRSIGEIPRIGVEVVRTPLHVDAAVTILSARAGVVFAEPDYIGSIALDPEDPCTFGCGPGRQWDLDAVLARAGWDIEPGTFYTQDQKKALSPVKVAVLDTKINEQLGDWINRDAPVAAAPWDSAEGGQLDVADAKDYVDPAQQEGSASYHGSFVAGIIGASAHNDTDIAGLAYAAQVVPVTVVDGNGRVVAEDLARAIIYAHARGARVINLSLGLDAYSQTVQSAVYAVARPVTGAPGALVVAAAGNNGNSEPFYPASMAGVMSVSALTEADRPGACTNHNGKVSVGAPGVGIISIDPTSGVSVAPCGTSTAAPHVSALAALLFAQDPSRTPDDVRGIIEQTADDANAVSSPGRDDYLGFGRINFERALLSGLRKREGLPPLPLVDRVRATVPRNAGGISVVTAFARAFDGRQLTGAEWFVDALGPPGTGGQLDPADGVLDGEDGEILVANVQVPLTIPAGVHRIYVRARDAEGWGAASSAALIVDRTPPTISELTATTAIGGLQPSQIAFSAKDDLSSQATYVVEVRRALGVTNEVVYRSQPRTIVLPANEETTWLPEITDVGYYSVSVTLTDEGGNPTSRNTTVLVL